MTLFPGLLLPTLFYIRDNSKANSERQRLKELGIIDDDEEEEDDDDIENCIGIPTMFYTIDVVLPSCKVDCDGIYITIKRSRILVGQKEYLIDMSAESLNALITEHVLYNRSNHE